MSSARPGEPAATERVQTPAKPATMRRVAAAGLAGATLEWYDFQLYAWMATLAFDELFFPTHDPRISTLVALVSFGVGFVARPVGALVFGHLGDRVGRKTILLATLLIVGLPTVATGLLPTYESIGIWAPILLVLFRLLQGFGLGGEFAGASLVIVEHAPASRRGFWGTWAGMGNPAGQLLSIIVVFSILASVSDAEFVQWAWRVPYLLGVLILLAGLYVRLRVDETPAFRELKESRDETRVPLKDLFGQYPLTILKAWGARVADAGTWAVFVVFSIGYMTDELGMAKSSATIGVALALTAQLIMIPVAGALSDRFGRRRVVMTGAVIVGLAIFPSFVLINTAQPSLVWLAMMTGFPIGTGLIFGPVGAYLPELFKASVRFSGTSVVFQLSALAAGFVPAVAAALYVLGGGTPWLVCGLVVVLAVVTFGCTYRLPETANRPLGQETS